MLSFVFWSAYPHERATGRLPVVRVRRRWIAGSGDAAPSGELRAEIKPIGKIVMRVT